MFLEPIVKNSKTSRRRCQKNSIINDKRTSDNHSNVNFQVILIIIKRSGGVESGD